MEQTQNTSVNNDKGNTIAIICYMTLIGWIIALVMHSENKTSLGAYHIRQMLGIIIMSFALSIVWFILMFIPIIGWLLGFSLWAGLIASWVMGLIAAVNKQEKPIPFIGILFQKWFASVGK